MSFTIVCSPNQEYTTGRNPLKLPYVYQGANSDSNVTYTICYDAVLVLNSEYGFEGNCIKTSASSGSWHWLKIKQAENTDGKVEYTISIDNKVVYEAINRTPKVYDRVLAKFGKDGRYGAKGLYANLTVTTFE